MARIIKIQQYFLWNYLFFKKEIGDHSLFFLHYNLLLLRILSSLLWFFKFWKIAKTFKSFNSFSCFFNSGLVTGSPSSFLWSSLSETSTQSSLKSARICWFDSLPWVVSSNVTIKVNKFVERDVEIDLITKLFFKTARSAVRVWTVSSSISSKLDKRSPSSSQILPTSFSEMPATLKPLVKVLFGRTCRDFVNLITADRMDIVGIGSVFSKADVSLQTAREQYLAFKARITPWSLGCVCDVVFRSRRIS